MIRISDALQILRPGAEWSISDNLYNKIEWLDKTQTKPTEEEVNAKIKELETAEPFLLLRRERNRLIFAFFSFSCNSGEKV